jgi:hypothetical protein
VVYCSAAPMCVHVCTSTKTIFGDQTSRPSSYAVFVMPVVGGCPRRVFQRPTVLGAV